MEEDQSPEFNTSISSNQCSDIGEYYASDWTTLISVRVFVGILYSLIFLIGVIGNAGVIVRVFSDRKLHTAQYVFLVNLMASDFLLCLTSVIFSPVAIIMKHWIFGGVLCRAIPLCQAMSVLITSFTLTLIAVDKYMHIVDATRPPLGVCQAFVAIGVIWTVSLAISMPLVLSYGVDDGSSYIEEFGVFVCGKFCDESWQPESIKRVYGTSIMFVQFVVPCAIIAFCYSSIMRKVRKDMMIENKQFASSLSDGQRLDAIRRKRKVTKILIMMVVAFVGSWAPLTFFNIFRDYGELPEFVDSQPFVFALLVHCSAMSSVIWNPLLFFWLTGRGSTLRKAGSAVSEGTFVTFLMALNPVRSIFKRNRSRSRTSESERCVVIRGADGSGKDDVVGSPSDSSSPAAVCFAAANDSLSPLSCPTFRNAVICENNNNDASGLATARTDDSPSCPPPSIIVNSFAKPIPTGRYRLISTNGRRAAASAANSPRLAPRVMAESFSDLSASFDDSHAVGAAGGAAGTADRLEDENDDEASMIRNEAGGGARARLTRGEEVGKRNKNGSKARKSLIYVHLGKSSQF